MINLIPHNARTAVKREYIARVTVVYLGLVTVGVVTAALLLFPAYLNITIEARTIAQQAASVTDAQEEATLHRETIERASELLDGVASFDATDPLLPAIYDLESVAGSDIQLNRFSVTRTEQFIVETITISGVAASRVALSSFEERLEAAESFGDVSIPLANLARESDIPFTLTVPIISQN